MKQANSVIGKNVIKLPLSRKTNAKRAAKKAIEEAQ